MVAELWLQENKHVSHSLVSHLSENPQAIAEAPTGISVPNTNAIKTDLSASNSMKFVRPLMIQTLALFPFRWLVQVFAFA